MITVFGISNCDKIRKTRKWLEQNGLAHTLHDYRKQGLDAALAKRLLQACPVQELINRRGTTWRQLPEAQRENLDDNSAIALIMEHPALIKRPLIHDGEHWLLGYDETEFANQLIRNTE